MVNYLRPGLTQQCLCRDDAVKAMLCSTGHMTECHYPMDCRMAGCGHLEQSGMDVSIVRVLRADSVEWLAEMADDGCELCNGSGIKREERSLHELFGMFTNPFTGLPDIPEDTKSSGMISVPCRCTITNMMAVIPEVENA